MSLVFAMSCVGSGLGHELVIRAEESYRLCVSVRDLEASTVRRPGPELGSCAKKKKLDSVVSMATRLRTGRSGVYPSRRQIFSYLKHPVRLWDPPSLLFIGYQGSFPGVKRSGIDTDYSPPSSGEVKNEWSYTSVTPICLPGVYRGNFTFNTMKVSV